MSQLRSAALVTLLAAAGCYSAVPPQSTTPGPQYVAGPPGGAIDPGYGYAYAEPSGGEDGSAAYAPGAASPDPVDDDAAGDGGGPAGSVDRPGDPAIAGAPGPGDVAQLGDDGAAQIDPTSSVTDPEIDTALDGHGEWVQTDDYGQVWRPDATEVGVDFTPYESGGSWEDTDAGWAFACDYPWGWLPFHYGRWAWFHSYWGWVPGHRWGPAWVDWRHGGGVIGWRPRSPQGHGSDHRWHGGDARTRDHRRAEVHDAHWRFAAVHDFARPHVRSHLFGDTAEGLRVTAPVAAPPLRGAPVRAADLMRNRFAGGARFAQPGSRGSAGGDRRGAQAVGAQAPLHTYQPPAQTYPRPPLHTYRPPATTYMPPRSYQPPARTYQPPPRTYLPPPRGYQPPLRTYQPSPQGTARPPIYQPTYRPPTYRPPTYRPPGASSPPPRASSPPSRGSSPPPSHASPPSSGGSHSSGGGGSSHASGGGGSSHSSSSSSSGDRHR